MFYALIIGNDVYDDKEFANLKGAVRDARKLSDFIQTRFASADCYGADQVKITLLTNPTSGEVRREFSRIVNLLDDESAFLFYFSGHGLCLNGEDKPSLLCSDAMEALLDGAVGAGEIAPRFITSMSRRGRGNMFFCFDVCRSAVFTGHGVPSPLRMKRLCRDATSRKGRDSDSGNRCALTSCRDRERASDDGSFVDAIIAEWDASLASRQGVFIGWIFVKRVSNRLRAKRLRQRPELSGTPFALTPGAKESVGESRWDAEPQEAPSTIASVRSLFSREPWRVVGAIALVVGAIGAICLNWEHFNREEPYSPSPQPRPIVVSPSKETIAKTVAESSLAKAKELFSENRLDAALSRVDEALEYDPNDGEALALKREIEEKLQDVAISELVDSGIKLLETKDAGDAISALKKSVEALELVPGHEGAKKLKENSTNAALAAANAASKRGDYSEAKRLAQEVLDVVKTDGNATAILSEAQAGIDKNAQVSTALTASRKLWGENELDAALAEVEKALALDPNHAESLALKKEIENQRVDRNVETLVADGWKALAKEDYEVATNKATAALQLRPNHAEATNLKSETTKRRAAAELAKQREEIRIEVAKLLNQGRFALSQLDYELAKSKANAALDKDPGNQEAKTLLADVEKAEQAARMELETARAALEKEEQTKRTGVWAESTTRNAGERRELEIKGVKYGFCWIPAGEFEMGSPESEQKEASENAKKYGWNLTYEDEKLHHVKLTKGFWMLETEVTQKLYEAVMGENPSKFEGADLPVERVSWDDAVAFCDELTKLLPQGLKAKLPTEAQWEYACRAGTRTPFSFGSVLNGDKANCDGNFPYGTSTKGKYLEKTTPVKSYAPNSWGLYDMHGNVWEWCLDWDDKEYPSGTVTDPVGPDSGLYRVCRGGSWYSRAQNCRSALRDGGGPGYRVSDLGFRVLLVCD